MIKFIFKAGLYEKTFELKDTDIRNIQIVAMWEGMKYARQELNYDDKLNCLSDIFNISPDRIRNIIHEHDKAIKTVVKSVPGSS